MTKLAWRGVVDRDGDVIAWPTLLATHNDAAAAIPTLRDTGSYRARWRQWSLGPDGPIDFDPGASDEDKAKVEVWVKAASA